MKKLFLLALVICHFITPTIAKSKEATTARFSWLPQYDKISEDFWKGEGKSVEIHTINYPGQRGLVTEGTPSLSGPLNLSKEIKYGAAMAKMDTSVFHQLGTSFSNQLKELGFEVTTHHNSFDARSLPLLKGGTNTNHSLPKHDLSTVLSSSTSDFALVLDLEVATLRVRRGGFAPTSKAQVKVYGVLYDVKQSRTLSAFTTYLHQKVQIRWKDSPSGEMLVSILESEMSNSANSILSNFFPDNVTTAPFKFSAVPNNDRNVIFTEIEAIRSKSKDYVGFNNCKKYYELSQDCSKKHKAGLRLRLNGRNLGFSANEEGNIVFMKIFPYLEEYSFGSGLVVDKSEIFNALHDMYSLLKDSGTTITRLDGLNLADNGSGFFIVADQEIYSLVKALGEQ